MTKAEKRVIQMAQRWHRRTYYDKPGCRCDECNLARAVIALAKLRRKP
jgi:hypothetical protein